MYRVTITWRDDETSTFSVILETKVALTALVTESLPEASLIAIEVLR